MVDWEGESDVTDIRSYRSLSFLFLDPTRAPLPAMKLSEATECLHLLSEDP